MLIYVQRAEGDEKLTCEEWIQVFFFFIFFNINCNWEHVQLTSSPYSGSQFTYRTAGYQAKPTHRQENVKVKYIFPSASPVQPG